MLESVAEYCTLVLVRQNVIEEKEKPVYLYGFALFFSTASSILAMLAISVLTDNLTNGLLYLTVFMALRITANGYHAESYRNCFLMTNAVFICYLLIVNFVPDRVFNAKANLAPVLFCIGYIWVKAPVEHPNHRLSEGRRRRNRYAARCIVLAVAGILAGAYYISCYYAAHALLVTLYIVVILMTVKNKEPVEQSGQGGSRGA